MMQQTSLFINLVSGFLFWLAALVSWVLLRFYWQSHVCAMTMLKATETQSCDVIMEHLWAAELSVRWAVKKKKKKLLSQGLPRKQMTPCPSFWRVSWLTFFFSISSQWCCSDSSAPSMWEPAKCSYCTPAFPLWLSLCIAQSIWFHHVELSEARVPLCSFFRMFCGV